LDGEGIVDGCLWQGLVMDWHGFLWSWLVQREGEVGVLGGGLGVGAVGKECGVGIEGVGGLVGVSLLFSRKGLLGLIGCSLGLWIPCSVDSSLFVSLAVGIGLLGVWSSNLPSLLLFSWCAWWASLSPVVFLPCSSWVFLGLVLSAWLGPSSCLFGRFLLAWFACPVGMFWFLSCSSVSLHFRVSLFPWLGCFSSCAALLFGFDFVVDSMAVLGGHRFRLRSSLVLLGHFSGSFSLSLGSVLRFLCSSWWAREFVSSSWLASRAWLYALGCSLLVGLSLLLLALVKLSVLLLAALPFPCRCLWVLVGRSGSRCVVGWNGGQGNSCAVFLGWLLVLDCTVLGC